MFLQRQVERKQRLAWPVYMQQQADKVRNPLLEAFYAASCPAADTPICEVPLVALDFETTGLDVQQHAIVSIGVVPFTLERISLAQRRRSEERRVGKGCGSRGAAGWYRVGTSRE